ncbi:phosphate transport system regulatory protein PhoU [Clostridia bacterium]|nr:phosphate transport system regulatory protein PhoU [Clostridia bacterium]
MRKRYEEQLESMHVGLIRMGAMCEEAIGCAAQALLEGDADSQSKTAALEHEIDMIERDIEQMCVRLLLHQQPMATDLRHVTAAQRMITDMERIGDQCNDIAEISVFMRGSPVKSDVHIADMAKATRKMVTDSIDSFVKKDLALARSVIAYDDIVDELFSRIKRELIERLIQDNAHAGECLDLLMIAKYFERLGDHAVNIADWVIYYLTGTREVSVGQ